MGTALLSNRWALVTGASDGIGAATARALAAKSFNVILVARRKEPLREIAREIEAHHATRAEIVAMDLSSADACPALLRAITDLGIEISSIDLAVLAAGFGTSGAFLDADPDGETNMIDVNCTTVVRLCHHLSATMAAKGSGQLVLFGSLVGFQGNAMSATYSATKAFVQTFAEGLAQELAPKGVQVLAVAPGPVASGFARRAGMTMGLSDTPETVAKGIIAALGRRGTIRPGRVSKLLGWSLALTPRVLRIRIMSAIMTGMAKPAPQTKPQGQTA